MILDTVLGVVLGVLRGVVELIPEWSPPEEMSGTWLDELESSISAINAYVPFTDFAICLGILLGVKAVLMVWHVIVWIYSKLPLKAT